jgi:hypothetical protein
MRFNVVSGSFVAAARSARLTPVSARAAAICRPVIWDCFGIYISLLTLIMPDVTA